MKKTSISSHLNDLMLSAYVSVSREQNPVMVNLEHMSSAQIQNILLQYSVFPKNIISLLVAAAYSVSYHNWTEVTKELTDNVTEELGVGKGKILAYNFPHYTLLRRILEGAFGVDALRVKANKPTKLFIKRIKGLVEDANPAIVCGTVYALESSAVPELSIVKELTLTALGKKAQVSPPFLTEFFDYHVNEIEVGHRDRLMDVIHPYLDNEDSENDFLLGFKQVLGFMDSWWIGLNKEVIEAKLIFDYERV